MFSHINIKQILFIGLILRLLAVFFSPGYAFSDDHFEVIELANEWYKGNISAVIGEGVNKFSLLYPGIHYFLIAASHRIGISDPEGIMIIVRLFHAIVSIAGIYYAWLLTSQLTKNKEVPLVVALLVAVFWMFPFMSVRSLREFFCIPFLLAGSYFSVQKGYGNRSIILSALFFVLAICIRIQCVFFPLATGLFWLLKKGQLKKSFVFGLSFLAFFFLTQGLFDWLYYGKPLASTLEYFHYNSNPQNIKEYPTGPWYQYMGTLAGMTLGVPFFILLAGYIHSAKLSAESKLLFVASLLFFIFHSYYANKQERFILPFLPYFLISGIVGFSELYQKHRNKKWIRKVSRFSIGWFVIVNTILLFVLTFSYSKRSRVESMNYLRSKHDVTGIIMEGPVNPPMPPLFYLGKRVDYSNINSQDEIAHLLSEIENKMKPNYIIFVGNKNLESRVLKIEKIFPQLKKEKEITPGFIDNIAHWLNPKHNQNESWYIYKSK